MRTISRVETTHEAAHEWLAIARRSDPRLRGQVYQRMIRAGGASLPVWVVVTWLEA